MVDIMGCPGCVIIMGCHQGCYGILQGGRGCMERAGSLLWDVKLGKGCVIIMGCVSQSVSD